MKATIEPLKGKYYGTKIIIEQEDSYGCITLWGALSHGEHSIRELEAGWDEDLCGMDHVEDAGDYELAQFICQQINEELG